MLLLYHGTTGASTQKASQSLRPQAQIKSIHFFRGHVPRKKYFSACKCASAASALPQAAAFSNESPAKRVSFDRRKKRRAYARRFRVE
jgi:hypothetical protein